MESQGAHVYRAGCTEAGYWDCHTRWDIHRFLRPHMCGGWLQWGWREKLLTDTGQGQFQVGSGLVVSPGRQCRLVAFDARSECHCGGDGLEFLARG